MQWLLLRLTHTWLCKFRCFLPIARYDLHSFLLSKTNVTFSHRKIINFHFETWYEKFIKRFPDCVLNSIRRTMAVMVDMVIMDRLKVSNLKKLEKNTRFFFCFIWIIGKSEALFLSAPMPSCHSLTKIPIYLLIWLKSYGMKRIWKLSISSKEPRLGISFNL